jgi:hypothetical protein
MEIRVAVQDSPWSLEVGRLRLETNLRVLCYVPLR